MPGQHGATACAPGTVSLLSDGSTQGQLRAQPWFCRVLAVFCGAVGSAHMALWCPVTCPILNLIVPLCGWHWVMCVWQWCPQDVHVCGLRCRCSCLGAVVTALSVRVVGPGFGSRE